MDIRRILSVVMLEGAPVNRMIEILAGKKSQWPGKTLPPDSIKSFARDVITKYDPSPDGKYSFYIARQIAAGPGCIIMMPDNPEDGPKIYEVLEWFDKSVNTAAWTTSKRLDDYPNWRSLAELHRKHDKKPLVSNSELENKMREYGKSGYDVAYDGVLTLRDFIGGASETPVLEAKIYRVLEPEAMPLLGNNTHWCTATLWMPRCANCGVDYAVHSDDARNNSTCSQYTPPAGLPSLENFSKLDFDDLAKSYQVPELMLTYPDWHPKKGTQRRLEYIKHGQYIGWACRAAYYLQESPQYCFYIRDVVGSISGKPDDKFRPYWQFDKDQLKNVNDEEVSRTTNQIDCIMMKWTRDGADPPMDLIQRNRRLWQAKITRGKPTAENPSGVSISDPYYKHRLCTCNSGKKWWECCRAGINKPVQEGNMNLFRPSAPSYCQEYTTVVSNMMLEAYDDEVLPDTIKFWRELPKNRQHIYAKHRLMALQGDKLSQSSYDFTAGRATKVNALSRETVGRAFGEIMHREARFKNELIQLAKAITAKVWGIPESMLNAMLTTEVDINPVDDPDEAPKPEQVITPELRAQINKRITLNALTQGSAVHNMMTMHFIADKEINKLDPRLLKLYDVFASGSHKDYWHIDFKSLLGGAVGSEKIEYQDDDQPAVVAKAFIFPILLQELSKGVAELISHHGLKGLDAETVKAVLGHADRAVDEPYLIQVGPEIWRRLLKAMPDADAMTKAKVYTMLAVQTPDKLDEILEAVIENPENAKDIVAGLIMSEPEEPEEVEDNEDWKESLPNEEGWRDDEQWREEPDDDERVR